MHVFHLDAGSLIAENCLALVLKLPDICLTLVCVLSIYGLAHDSCRLCCNLYVAFLVAIYLALFHLEKENQ